MESYLRKSVHVEFYGMPGCGKSTVSALVADCLRISGYVVYEPSRDIGNEIMSAKRKFVKIVRSLKYSLFFPCDAYKILHLVKKNDYSGFSMANQYINLVQKFLIYRLSEKRIGIYLWDEGLTQAAVSLGINGNVQSNENETFLRKILGSNENIIKIYFKDSTAEILVRLEKRKGGNSRVEKTNSLERKKELIHLFDKQCDLIINDKNNIIVGDSVEQRTIKSMKILSWKGIGYA